MGTVPIYRNIHTNVLFETFLNFFLQKILMNLTLEHKHEISQISVRQYQLVKCKKVLKCCKRAKSAMFDSAFFLPTRVKLIEWWDIFL